MKSEGGLGSFLNPGKLLTKDKKSTAMLRSTEPTTGTNNSYSENKKSPRITREDTDTMDSRRMNRASQQEEDDYRGRRWNRDTYQDRRQDYDDQQDDIRTRPRRKSQRSNEDEFYERRQPEQRDIKSQTKNRINSVQDQLSSQKQTLKKNFDDFNRKLRRIIDEQFSKFKQAVISTVQQVIANYQQEFKQNYQEQQSAQLEILTKTRDRIEALTQRLNDMTDDIGRGGWRNVAVTLDSQEFQSEFDQVMEIQQLEPGNIQIRFNDKRMNEFGTALQKLMKVEFVRKKQSSKRKLRI